MASYEQVGGTDTGRVGVCGGLIETALPNEAASGSAPPTRKRLDHRGPLSVDVSSAWYFITICAEERCGRAVSMKPPPTTPFLARAMDILDAARFRHVNGIWFWALSLVMPDHIHLIAKFPMAAAVSSRPPYRANPAAVSSKPPYQCGSTYFIAGAIIDDLGPCVIEYPYFAANGLPCGKGWRRRGK